MRVAGVIAEYNPMHNGHWYHLQKTKEETGADTIVAVISGHFLQRGEPAILNKWARTEMALRNGVDLVLELPVVYSTQSARLFAFGAVATLHATGIVDVLSFGSEQGDIRSLQQLSDMISEPPDLLQTELAKELEIGHSYPSAFAKALSTFIQKNKDLNPELINHPNNMLGLEYLHALKKLNSPICPYTIRRIASGYHDITFNHAEIASATAIRKAITDRRPFESYLPDPNLAIIQREFAVGRGPVTWNSFTLPLFTLIARSTPEQLETFAHFDEEGMAARIIHALPYASTVTELIYKAKTRRYTWTRIQRALTALLLGLKKSQLDSLQLENGPDSIRVLGFTEKGRALLKKCMQVASLPVITNITKDISPMIEANILATSVYCLGFPAATAGNRLTEPKVPVVSVTADF